MARIYSRRKGQAGSTRPSERKAPSWQAYKGAEVESLIVKLAKEGKAPSQIGLILRDSYGIPDIKATLKKQVLQILREKGIMSKLPEDLTSLLRRIVALQKHLEKNHKDESARRGLIITESKIGRIVKYYKNSKVLPETWKYDRENVQLLLK
jgi:small subunit ribosomal protein S15